MVNNNKLWAFYYLKLTTHFFKQNVKKKDLTLKMVHPNRTQDSTQLVTFHNKG